MSAYELVVRRVLHVPYMLHLQKFHIPKNPRATVVFIHGLGNSAEAWREVAALLPKDIQVVAIDLLGFGKSPKPKWVKYNLGIQARSVMHTLIINGLKQRPIIVGHSMGALVAVAAARRFPPLIKQLLLCSPPLYKSTPEEWISRDKMLKDIYTLILKYPGQIEKLAPFAQELGIVSKAFDVKGEQAKTYVAALESSIINQSSLDDIRKLGMPIRVLYGVFDPVVIGANLKKIDNEKPNMTVRALPVGHEIIGKYVQYIADELAAIVK